MDLRKVKVKGLTIRKQKVKNGNIRQLANSIFEIL
jgi:hypothetical protein